MKRLLGFFRWLSVCLIVVAFLVLYYFEDTLPITQNEHTLIAVGLVIILFIVLFSWINHNETNFIVPPDYLCKISTQKDDQKKLEQK